MPLWVWNYREKNPREKNNPLHSMLRLKTTLGWAHLWRWLLFFDLQHSSHFSFHFRLKALAQLMWQSVRKACSSQVQKKLEIQLYSKVVLTLQMAISDGQQPKKQNSPLSDLKSSFHSELIFSLKMESPDIRNRISIGFEKVVPLSDKTVPLC